MNAPAIEVRRASPIDARAAAQLHAARITEGFLPKLGQAFLTRLYRRVVRSDDAALYVAVAADGSIVGFGSVAADVSRLYRRFIVRDGLVAGTRAAIPILRNVRHVLETLRYPAHTEELPAAEILAVAVDPGVAGRGVGRALVDALLRDSDRMGVAGLKVVAGADNAAALGLYRSAGFAEAQRIEVHAGIVSVVLVRRVPLRGIDGARRDA